MLCYFCQHSLQFKYKINREETCVQCGKYIHCCLNCRFYHPDAHHQCKEPVAEWVRDKEVANFCDYFEPNEKKSSWSSISSTNNASQKACIMEGIKYLCCIWYIGMKIDRDGI